MADDKNQMTWLKSKMNKNKLKLKRLNRMEVPFIKIRGLCDHETNNNNN